VLEIWSVHNSKLAAPQQVTVTGLILHWCITLYKNNWSVSVILGPSTYPFCSE